MFISMRINRLEEKYEKKLTELEDKLKTLIMEQSK